MEGKINTIIATSKDDQLIWIRAYEDKWVEQFWHRDIKENGDVEWVHVHDVRHTTTENIEGFISKLQEVGFTIGRG